jgi:hypothetical protein
VIKEYFALGFLSVAQQRLIRPGLSAAMLGLLVSEYQITFHEIQI